jgi:hypothetical protein
VDAPKPSSLTNVFGLDNPQHIYTKMMVELMRFQDASSVWTKNEPFPESLFIAFNLAVTIWHMTDWLWMSSPTARQILKKRYSLQFDEKTQSGLEKGLCGFQKAVRAERRSLHVCEEIANASKHMRRRKTDPSIKAVVEWHEVIEAAGHAHKGDLLMSLSIVDNGKKQDATLFFIDAIAYWEGLLRAQNLLSEDAILPQKIVKKQS